MSIFRRNDDAKATRAQRAKAALKQSLLAAARRGGLELSAVERREVGESELTAEDAEHRSDLIGHLARANHPLPPRRIAQLAFARLPNAALNPFRLRRLRPV